MAQTRFVNFGDTVLAQRINEISTAIVVPAVLEGAEMTVGLGGKSVNIAPHKVMLNEILLVEDATTNLVIADTLPVDPTDYTIVYEHNNQQVQGGVPALLLVRTGLIGFDSIPNTVVVGWIRWPGTGTQLQQAMFIEAPKLQIKNPTEFPADIKAPPFVPQTNVTVTCSGVECPVGVSYDAVATTPLIYTASVTGEVNLVDFFNPLDLKASLTLTNPSASIGANIVNLVPFVADLQPPNRIILEAKAPLGGSIEASLLDEEGNEYVADNPKITNTAGQFEYREMLVINVDTTKFAQNRPYFVKLLTKLNSSTQAEVSLVGTSSNFLPV
jgi:hypothetical protein